MSEMRQHLIRMNREKMMERGALTEREAALMSKYSSLNGLATLEFSSESAVNTATSSDDNSSTETERVWRELLY